MTLTRRTAPDRNGRVGKVDLILSNSVSSTPTLCTNENRVVPGAGYLPCIPG